MNQLQTILNVAFFQNIQSLEQLRGVEPELALVASALAPFAGTCRGQFDAYSHIGTHFKPLADFGNHPQFVELFHNEVYFATHLLRQQSQLDIGGILVAVAYYQRILVDVGAENGV